MRKTDIEFHNLGYGNECCPAINVKVYSLGVTGAQVAEKFSCSEADAEKALELAFEHHQGIFWEDIQNTADECFEQTVKVYSEGRSAGWLVVEGLPEVKSWDAIQLSKWASFCKMIQGEIKFLTSAAELCSTIKSNQYYKPGSEEYNFVERADGSSVCIADLKAQAISQGFGPVVK